MKKVLALLAVAAMTVSLVACGGKTEKGTISEVEQESIGEAAESLQAELEGALNDLEDALAEGETTAAETEAEEFALGSTTNLVYENASIGIGCKLPENWIAYDEEQIAEVNGWVKDNASTEEMKELLENASYIYDMVASDEEQINNMNVIVQNLTILQTLSAGSADIEDLLEQSEGALVENMEGMGVENIEFKIDRGLKFPVENYASGVLTGTYSDIPLTERMVMFIKGNKLVNITVAAFGDDITEDVLAGFYALD